MPFTKGQINRLGDRIRKDSTELSGENLIELQAYRKSHKEPLSEVFQTLCDLSNKVRKASIVTYRIKRFESIITKLSRYPKMQFSRMWDIGGCRCIFKSDKEVYKLEKLIESKYEVRKKYDYIENPQEDGYRSLHLFVVVPESNIIIEVQIRNSIDHNWATLVEITDLLFDAKLKEYGENQELLRFHYLLSKLKNLSMPEKKEVAKIVEKYSYFEKLSEVFSRNYLDVRRQWLKIQNQKNHKYFLIQAEKNKIPKIRSFLNFEEAEEDYFKLYKENQTSNIVLTRLPTPNYKQISMAYSNYVLTVHNFMDDCLSIIEDLTHTHLKNKNLIQFYRFFDLYNKIIHNHLKNLRLEILEALEFPYLKSKKRKKHIKEWEWVRDVQKQVDRRVYNVSSFRKKLFKDMPNSVLLSFIFRRLVSWINLKYMKKFEKIVSTK